MREAPPRLQTVVCTYLWMVVIGCVLRSKAVLSRTRAAETVMTPVHDVKDASPALEHARRGWWPRS
jgi:hypothetical protein